MCVKLNVEIGYIYIDKPIFFYIASLKAIYSHRMLIDTIKYPE